MANFEDYINQQMQECNLQDSNQGNDVSTQSILGTTTFRNLKLEEDTPLFSKMRINFVPPHPITHLVVSNSHIVLALGNKTLIRIDLNNPNNLEEIDLTKLTLQAKIHNMFFDPTGHHLLISVISREGTMNPVDTLYLPWRSTKPKSCNKLKGHLVTAVAWNYKNQSENFTGPILVGTSKGAIIELELTSDEGLFQAGLERNFKQVFDISRNDSSPFICNIEANNCPTDSHMYLILCSTYDKLYQFSGHIKGLDDRPFYGAIFQRYQNQSPKLWENSSSWKSAWLKLFRSAKSLISQHYAWLTEQCVTTADINWTEGIKEDMSMNKKIYNYSEGFDIKEPPCDMIMTQFHILIAWPHCIKGFCWLNTQPVYDDKIKEECGKIIGMTKDAIKGTIWVYAEKAIFRYQVDKEARNVWQIYLDQEKYDLAKKHCDSNPLLLEQVYLREAQDLFAKKKYSDSAKLFAIAPMSFEAVGLKFLEAGEEDALKIYLRETLDKLKISDHTQVLLITMWLMEHYLQKLGNLRDTGRRNTAEYHNIDEEFKSFMKETKVRSCITQNSKIIFQLLASHDDQDNFITLSFMLKDFDRVLSHLVHHRRYMEALEILKNHGSPQMFLTHIPILLHAIPKQTVDILIAQGIRLDPLKLIPTLVQAHASYGRSDEVLRYLEHCIHKLDVRDEVLHNFLITLYASQDPKKLMSYLELQGDSSTSVCYDVKFALRECMSVGEDRACVHILTIMELYQEAVELALKLDQNLAKAIANRTKNEPDLCKKLWLIIAEHVVKEKQDISSAMHLLKECNLIKIEDILPHFPDFVTIDQFKDAICSSLQEYNQHIENLKQEMDEASKTAEHIRSDIQKYKQKFSYVHAQDRCSECNYPLLTRPFYLFPCSHKFHQDCLSDAVLVYLNPKQQKQVADLKGKLLALSGDETSTNNLWSDREQIRAKIDSIVAGECLYCGDIAVDSVDLPFIEGEEWNTLTEEWK